MKKFDTLERFLFEHASIRGEIVHLKDAYKTIINQHPYPPMVKNLLGEALISCILLTSTIKFEGEISLQFNGDKRLPLLIVQCTNNLTVRACAKYQKNNISNKDDEKDKPDGGFHKSSFIDIKTLELSKNDKDYDNKDKNVDELMEQSIDDIDYNSAFLAGKMVITINQYNKTEIYQSIVPINSTSMSENLMNYFAQSEQLSSKIWMAVGEESASGMMLQLMPDQDTTKREEFWEYAVQIGQTITDDELLNLDTKTILHRLYHETELRLFEPRDVKFQCKCSEERMKQAASVLGEADLQKLLKERGKIDITCDFCNQQYTFDAIDIAMLFHKK